MTDDRYVIVHRDGQLSCPMPQQNADWWLRCVRNSPNPPAYRIRIREKPLPLHMTFVARMLDRLDPAKAYRAAGLRK